MLGHSMTSCVGCTLVAKSPGCRAADYSAPLVNIEFCQAVKPGSSWKFCNRFHESIWSHLNLDNLVLG